MSGRVMKPFWYTLLLGVSLVLLLTMAAWHADLRLNRSDSLPGLLWQYQALTTVDTQPIHWRGQVVYVCPPDTPLFQEARTRGYIPLGLGCGSGYTPLLKPVAATAGDKVTLTEQGILVNDQLQPNSKPLIQDSAGRAMPVLSKASYRIQPGQVWLLSTYHSRSFDSRYFGPISIRHITGLGKPLFPLAIVIPDQAHIPLEQPQQEGQDYEFLKHH